MEYHDADTTPHDGARLLVVPQAASQIHHTYITWEKAIAYNTIRYFVGDSKLTCTVWVVFWHYASGSSRTAGERWTICSWNFIASSGDQHVGCAVLGDVGSYVRTVMGIRGMPYFTYYLVWCIPGRRWIYIFLWLEALPDLTDSGSLKDGRGWEGRFDLEIFFPFLAVEFDRPSDFGKWKFGTIGSDFMCDTDGAMFRADVSDDTFIVCVRDLTGLLRNERWVGAS